MMDSQDEIRFDDVSAKRLKKYLEHAIEIVEKRHARYQKTHDKKGHELPKILINPVEPEVLKAGKTKTITQVVDTKEELSPKLKKELKDETKARHTRLKKKYDRRIKELQLQIAGLEQDIVGVLDELDQYVKGTHPQIAHHESHDDLEHEIAVLEHKLGHFEQKSENYHELVGRLTDARSRLDALDV